ncbi:MAG: hypothetical protein ACK44O_05515 [Novosphingobium sp.]|jgi:hypothetical protein|uniref:hypothetical protein n=1 Tax=Novosphingobium sp. TaxID=1874826 RepID=UPI00391BEF92|nr:hypothetical protein [Novosphingobium sp.]
MGSENSLNEWPVSTNMFGAANVGKVSGSRPSTGRHPQRQLCLPFALPASRTAVLQQHPDAPGYDAEGTLYPFGFGLGFNTQHKQAAK